MVKFILSTVFISIFLSPAYATNKTSLFLVKDENLRTLKNNILEIVTKLPAGTKIEIDEDSMPVIFDYRSEAGQILRSSNGFFTGFKIQYFKKTNNSFINELIPNLSDAEVDALNSTVSGLFISSTSLQASEEVKIFKKLDITNLPASDEYLKTFSIEGKPSFNFTKYFEGRFPLTINGKNSRELSSNEKLKWLTVFNEIKKAVNREVDTEANLFYMPVEDAVRASIDYEEKGLISTFGAWSVAVKATAPRHDFPNVPCAEFVSEVIRQAYARSGYDINDDFSFEKGTKLIWHKTAAVVNLANTLYKAGFIPWELVHYKAPVGAIMMNYKADSPGHTYFSGGFDGRVIVDNGSPAGRSLYSTSDKIIKMMFYGGVFFLPPGITPEKW